LPSDAAALPAGVKVWFQLADGRFVSPTHHRWQPGEQFYIHLEAPVPLRVALFQNYPEDRPASRQVYPDRQYPESFRLMMPGQSTRLPTLFSMDKDLRDELMSIVVARVDCTEVPVVVMPDPGVVSGTITTDEGIMKSADAKFAEINHAALKDSTWGGQSTKFQISNADVDISRTADEVAVIMLSPGLLGQCQFTLKK